MSESTVPNLIYIRAPKIQTTSTFLLPVSETNQTNDDSTFQSM